MTTHTHPEIQADILELSKTTTSENRTKRVSLGATPGQFGAWRNAAEESAARLREAERRAKLERQGAAS